MLKVHPLFKFKLFLTKNWFRNILIWLKLYLILKLTISNFREKKFVPCHSNWKWWKKLGKIIIRWNSAFYLANRPLLSFFGGMRAESISASSARMWGFLMRWGLPMKTKTSVIKCCIESPATSNMSSWIRQKMSAWNEKAFDLDLQELNSKRYREPLFSERQTAT